MYSPSGAHFQARETEPDSLAVAILVLTNADAVHGEVALAYGANGIPVFPLRADTKKPYMKGGHHIATVDEVMIRRWWAEAPSAMIGIPAGPSSGLWLVDLDEREADPKRPTPRRGITELRDLGFEPLSVAKCIVETPSAGLHLVFRMPGGLHIPNRAGDIGSGIDVRGTTRFTVENADHYTAPGYECWPQIVSGGYFVAAGSKRADGRRYVFKAGSYLTVEPAPLDLLRMAVFSRRERGVIEADAKLQSRLASAAPQSWAELFAVHRAERAAETTASPVGQCSGPRDVGAYARAACENARADLLAAREGQRDNTLWKVACSLMELVKAGVVAQAAVEADVREAALAIGLEERIIADKLRRAYNHVEARDLSRVQVPARPKHSANGHACPEPGWDEAERGDEPELANPRDGNEVPGEEAGKVLPPIPADFLNIPGPMGDLACYLWDVDPVSDEVRALALAIGVMMALTNGAFKCVSGPGLTTYTDLIVVNVDDSASGKTTQFNRIQSILARVIDDPIQRPFRRTGSFGSPEGFWDLLTETGKKRGLCAITVMIDEFGGELAAMSRDRSYKRGLAEVLRNLTNAGGVVIDPPAMSHRSKAADREALNYPVVSVLGITTAKQFLEPLSSDRLLEDGTEGRFLVLPSQAKRVYDEVDVPEPEKLVSALKIIGKAMLDVARSAGGREPDRISVQLAQGIKEALKQLRVEQHRDADALERQGGHWGPMIRRRAEHVLKLAMLWAISAWAASARPQNPILDQTALSWAHSVVAYKEAGHRTIRDAHISRSERSEEYRHLRDRVLAMVMREHRRRCRRKDYKGVPMRDVMRALNLDREEASKAVNSLLAQGKLSATDGDGKCLEEVPPRNQRVLLQPFRAEAD